MMVMGLLESVIAAAERPWDAFCADPNLWPWLLKLLSLEFVRFLGQMYKCREGHYSEATHFAWVGLPRAPPRVRDLAKVEKNKVNYTLNKPHRPCHGRPGAVHVVVLHTCTNMNCLM